MKILSEALITVWKEKLKPENDLLIQKIGIWKYWDKLIYRACRQRYPALSPISEVSRS